MFSEAWKSLNVQRKMLWDWPNVGIKGAYRQNDGLIKSRDSSAFKFWRV